MKDLTLEWIEKADHLEAANAIKTAGVIRKFVRGKLNLP